MALNTQLIELAKKQLSKHEGIRYVAYYDTEGIPTIGIGHNIQDKPLPKEVVDLLFNYDLADALRDAERWLGAKQFDSLNTARKLVVLDMAFNLGYNRLSGFQNFRAAMLRGNWARAAQEMENSKWYRQVKTRGVTLCRMMRTGEVVC